MKDAGRIYGRTAMKQPVRRSSEILWRARGRLDQSPKSEAAGAVAGPGRAMIAVPGQFGCTQSPREIGDVFAVPFSDGEHPCGLCSANMRPLRRGLGSTGRRFRSYSEEPSEQRAPSPRRASLP